MYLGLGAELFSQLFAKLPILLELLLKLRVVWVDVGKGFFEPALRFLFVHMQRTIQHLVGFLALPLQLLEVLSFCPFHPLLVGGRGVSFVDSR